MPQIIWTLIASWRYYRRAQTIYQIHSPLAYQLIELIRAKEQAYYAFTNIAALKELALRDKTVINRMDFGTGKKINRSPYVALRKKPSSKGSGESVISG